MAHVKKTYVAREGVDLNKFNKISETASSVILQNAPTSVSVPGTPFNVAWMNELETTAAQLSNLNVITDIDDIPALGTGVYTATGATGAPTSGAMLYSYLGEEEEGALTAQKIGAVEIWKAMRYNSEWLQWRCILSSAQTFTNALGQTTRDWSGMCATPSNAIYACVYNGDIYKQTDGVGDFIALSQTTRNWRSMGVTPSGDVYACVANGDIYKQTGGTGDFIALSQTSRGWSGIWGTPSGDVYACVYNGDIYKQTGGTGDFIALSQTTRNWRGGCANSSGDVYACVYGGDIYKQTGGTGDFTALSQTSRNWHGMGIDIFNNIYACVYGGDIYKQTGGTGDFIALSQAARNCPAVCGTPSGDLYACVYAGDIYKTDTTLIIPDLRVFATVAAAVSGGIPTGGVFKTSSGVMMIV